MVKPAPQAAGAPCSKSGWKSHWTGSVRSSTAVDIAATWAQSSAVMVPAVTGVASGSTVSSLTGWPVRSVHEAARASAWSAKSVVGVWYAVMAR